MKEVNSMDHVSKVTRQLPQSAWEWPASHTLEFIQANMPQSIFDVIKLIVIHVKNAEEN